MVAINIQLCADRLSGRKTGHPDRSSAQLFQDTITGDSIMRQIPLTQGKFAIVDDEDFEWLNQWKWCADKQKGRDRFYASRNIYDGRRQHTTGMHRVIMQARKGQEIDHINGNGLDNRRCNLRFCTHRQNCMNQLPQKETSSQYKGVCWDKQYNKWRVVIKDETRMVFLGLYDSEIKAAKIYDKAAKELFGEFANLNFKN